MCRFFLSTMQSYGAFFGETSFLLFFVWVCSDNFAVLRQISVIAKKVVANQKITGSVLAFILCNEGWCTGGLSPCVQIMLSRFTFCVPTLYLLRFARVKRAQVGSTLLSRWFHEEIAVYGGVSVVHKEKRWAFCENRSLFWPKRSAFFCRNSCLAGVYSCLADSWSWWRLSGSKVKG